MLRDNLPAVRMLLHHKFIPAKTVANASSGSSKTGEDRNLFGIRRRFGDALDSLVCGGADKTHDLAAIFGGEISPGRHIRLTHIVGISVFSTPANC